MEKNYNYTDEELCRRINQALEDMKNGRAHTVTPEYLAELDRRREERRKAKLSK